MAKPPIIGIACRRIRGTSTGPSSVGVRSPYLESIAAAGGVPILIPLTNDQTHLRACFDLCDGVLLAGGEDVDPSLYGAVPHEKLGDVCRERDDLEITLARWCHEMGRPLLGICRGLQVINVALGGTLIQDIPSEVPNALIHNEDEGWESTPHTVTISRSSLLHGIVGEDVVTVNSLHHQAIDVLAPGLVVTARCGDGIIEGIEGAATSFFVAVQWHPEAMWQRKDPRWLKLFRALVHSSQGLSPGT